MERNFCGKSVLITNFRLNNYAGSELNSLRTAKAFQKKGADVEVATLSYGLPISDDFQRENIKVTDINKSDVGSKHYDLIWCQHAAVLTKLLFENKVTADRIIYSSLGPKEPLEAPPQYAALLTECLAVSKETKCQCEKEVNADFTIFPNTFDEIWTQGEYIHKPDRLNSIAVITNHCVDEVKTAADILTSRGYSVDFIGDTPYGTARLITPDVISKYDCVITIGKTVINALAMQKPVYCYDIYGGPGYLTTDNFDEASENNFSGRGFSMKTGEEISKEIEEDFSMEVLNIEKLANVVYENYSWEKKFSSLMKGILDKNKVDIEKILSDFSNLARVNRSIIDFYNSNVALSSINNELSRQLNKQIEKNKVIKKRNEEILKSSSWKLTKPLRKISQIINKKRKPRPKIYAIMNLHNEEYWLPGLLKSIENYVDGIVVTDDGSVDSTYEILKKCKKVIDIRRNPKHDESFDDNFDEKTAKEVLIRRATELGADWVLCCDGDERFEVNFLKELRNLVSAGKKCYVVHFRELWDSAYQYRVDNIWGRKEKALLFPVDKTMTFDFPYKVHVPWTYKEIEDKLHPVDYNLYHFKMINEKERWRRSDIYNKLDPTKEVQEIGYDYLVDTNGLKLEKIDKDKMYDESTVPKEILEIRE